MRNAIFHLGMSFLILVVLSSCGGGGGGSPVLIGKLDTSFGGTGYVVHNSAAGGNSYSKGNGVAIDSSRRIVVTGCSYNNPSNLDMVIWRYK